MTTNAIVGKNGPDVEEGPVLGVLVPVSHAPMEREEGGRREEEGHESATGSLNDRTDLIAALATIGQGRGDVAELVQPGTDPEGLATAGHTPWWEV